MAKSEDFFEGYEPHSQYKLSILKAYFEMWGRKMLLRRDAGSTVVYVDVCAGQGMDDLGNHGSPLIAARAAAIAQAQLSKIAGRPIQVQVIAIEKHKGRHAELMENLAPFKDGARALRGTLADHIASIETEFGDVPTLYFIDPFGLEPLDGSLVRRALSRPKNEALILFAEQAALRHFGAAVSQQTKIERKLQAIGDGSDDLFPDHIEEQRRQLEPKARTSKLAQQITRERAIEILDAAFMSHDWLARIEGTARADRRNAFIGLYIEFLSSCGADYQLRIPVLKADAARAYTLMHASRNAKGYTTMKEAVEYSLRHGPLDAITVQLTRDEMRSDPTPIRDMIRSRFAGRTVRWAEDKAQPDAECIRNIVLKHTAMMPGQLDEIKLLLTELRDPAHGKKWYYTFPRQK